MDFLIINKNKLKVKISLADMKKMDINFQGNESCDLQTRRSLWKLLDTANAECGFNTSGERLLLQFYENADGSEIFVTKLGKSGARIERTVARTQNVTLLCSRRVVLQICDIIGLIKLCRCLSADALENTAALYYSDENGSFYLIYDDRYGAETKDLDRIFEFSVQIPSGAEPYILEHSIKIGSNEAALRVLSEL